MKFRCMTTMIAEHKLLTSHSISSLHSVWIHHIRKNLQNVLYRIHISGSCINNQQCNEKALSSSYYHRDGHFAGQIVSLSSMLSSCQDCGKSVKRCQSSVISNFKIDEYFKKLNASEKRQHKAELACDVQKIENYSKSLQNGQKISNLMNLSVCSSWFTTSESRIFDILNLPAKQSIFSIGSVRLYHTKVPSLLRQNSCSLQYGWSSLLDFSVYPDHQNRHQSTLPKRFDIHNNPTYKQYLDSLLCEFEHISKILNNPASVEEVNSKELNSRIVHLTPLVFIINQLDKLEQQIHELDLLVSGLSTTDTEMKKMAQTEREESFEQMEQLQMQLIDHLVGQEQVDNNDIILEVSAGVGGQEAMLFTGEMFDLYQEYSQWRGWSFEIITCDRAEQGGLRKASASVCGMGVYRLLKFESGVHRVQRVPKTEKAGRVHTSTITVAVLPQPTEIDVVIQQKDLRVETFRSSGKGGQHVNTTDSAVRIVHLPTGTVAECQQGRSQIQNKKLALQILRSRIYEKELEIQQRKYKADRKLQVGTAGRSEKCRTYNFNQDRITDHRINYNMFNLGHFMSSGEDLNDMIAMLIRESQYEQLDDMLQDFAKNRKKQSS